MEKPVLLHDSRPLLVISIFCTAFFVSCLILSTLSGIRKQDMETLKICIPSFGGLSLLGLLLSLNFARRKLILFEDRISYTPPFGRTRCFSYSEVQHALPRGEQYILFAHDGSKMAVFEVNMPGYPEAIRCLLAHQVKVIPPQPLLPSPFFEKTAGWIARFNRIFPKSHYRSTYNAQAAQKQKRIANIIRILLTILCIVILFLTIL